MKRPPTGKRTPSRWSTRWSDSLLAPVAFLAWLVGRLPLRVVQALGVLLGWLWFWFVPIRRTTVLENIARALPLLSTRQRWSVALRTYRHVAITVLELFWATHVEHSRLHAAVITHGLEHYDRLRKGGRGVIAVTAHIGNWDLLACSQALAGVPLNVVTKELGAPGLNQLWMSAREGAGVRLIAARGSALELINVLRRGEVVGLVVDQRTPQDAGGRKVPFFGIDAWTTMAPHVLAARTDAALLPVWSYRQPDGRHAIHVGEEIPRGRRAEDTMAAINQHVESWVRDHPEQFLWHHRRWHP